eukprot:732006-Pleurochrysis_carterae.AAC.1
MEALGAEARGGQVRWRSARTLVGRLCNLAQAFPDLKPLLRGGYAVSRPATGAARGWRRAGEDVASLRP